MYISEVIIKNFRNFKEKKVEFNEGVNVIIGHNNSGKTNLIKALSLILDFNGSKRLEIDDFSKSIQLEELKVDSPKIEISITIKKGVHEGTDDLATIGNWLVKLEDDYEAELTYEFFLPEKNKQKYIDDINALSDTDSLALKKAWNIIKHDFLRLYTYKIWGGSLINQSAADSDSLKKIDFQFLNAIRDVERDMLTGRNSLLKDVLDFFMDYEIKIAPESTKTKEEKLSEIKQKKIEFREKSDELLSHLQTRMSEGKKQILSYAKETGASFNKANPNFEGSISDVEMFSALKLIVEYESGIKIPATHNGLGYNNLIFMSLLLAKMQVKSDGNYMGNNAKVFTTLAIEEPEAHLHPAMQYKFLKFLKENFFKRKVRQIFITSHSTHITSAVSLDEIICLHSNDDEYVIGYPGKAISDEKSKKYVQRFLDATKSDMLFAQKVILVEGLAEQLLFSILANYLEKSLEDNHVAVINVGGRYFNHFLNLFDKKSPNTIHKKIVCISDRDPERKRITGKSFNKCYPYEYNQEKADYSYKNNSSKNLYQYRNHPNIRFFSQDFKFGKTFEYDLLLHNPSLELLILDSMANKVELKELMKYYDEGKPISDYITKLRSSDENTRICDSITSNTKWNNEDKKKAIIASRYLNSVGKGENALELAYSLESNLLKKGTPDFKEFVVPFYIKEAIEWICQ